MRGEALTLSCLSASERADDSSVGTTRPFFIPSKRYLLGDDSRSDLDLLLYCSLVVKFPFARTSKSKPKLEPKRGGETRWGFGAAGRPPRGLRGPRGHGGSPRDRACPGRPSSSTSRTDLRRSRSVDRRALRRRPRWSGLRRARRLLARAHARGRGRSRRALSEVVALGLRVSLLTRGVVAEELGRPRCLLLASRGFRARTVGSPARRATRAGGAHADAARAGA